MSNSQYQRPARIGRLVSTVALLALLFASGPPARADAVTDCNEAEDASTRIRGCDIIIAEGAAPAVLAVAHMNRAIGYAAKGAFAKAIADLDAAIEIDPDLLAAHYNRGNVNLELGQAAEAILDFSTVIEQLPDFPLAWLNRGLAREHSGDREGAAVDYAKALALDRTLAAARRGLARVRPTRK
ncbi:MAG: tetratricopeptide repeat protein [Hyphomicrobiaceae bacterium]|nr:tetratricopeptide repeat protein [Hyphomicrobiaceae bacterium]